MAFSSASLELAEPLSAMQVCCLFSCVVSVVQTVPDLCERFWLPAVIALEFYCARRFASKFVECFFIIDIIAGNIFLLFDFGVGIMAFIPSWGGVLRFSGVFLIRKTLPFIEL